MVPINVNNVITPERMGKFLAHEIGHYLGLEHLYTYLGGKDGLEDQLSDTDKYDTSNLMDAYNNGERILTPQQVQIILNNPLIESL